MHAPLLVDHVAGEIAPHCGRGGLGVAMARLVEQLAALGVGSRVIAPAGASGPGRHVAPWGQVHALALPSAGADRITALTDRALELRAQLPRPPAAVIAHDHEAAIFTVHARARRPAEPLVLWLHSLYDTPHPSELPARLRDGLRSDSILASAIASADRIVASGGIMADAGELEWPARLRGIQLALIAAAERGAVLELEADQCLPAPVRPPPSPPMTPRPLVVFGGRASVHKGLGIFVELADRLRELDAEFVVLGDPVAAGLDPTAAGVARIRWQPWLAPEQFRALLRRSCGVCFPSVVEGFGLAAAEAGMLGVPILHHDVGGLRGLAPPPPAVSLELDASERAALYRLWGRLCGASTAAGWVIWAEARASLATLIDRWTEHLRALVLDPPAHGSGRTERSPSWGASLASALCLAHS